MHARHVSQANEEVHMSAFLKSFRAGFDAHMVVRRAEEHADSEASEARSVCLGDAELIPGLKLPVYEDPVPQEHPTQRAFREGALWVLRYLDTQRTEAVPEFYDAVMYAARQLEGDPWKESEDGSSGEDPATADRTPGHRAGIAAVRSLCLRSRAPSPGSEVVRAADALVSFAGHTDQCHARMKAAIGLGQPLYICECGYDNARVRYDVARSRADGKKEGDGV